MMTKGQTFGFKHGIIESVAWITSYVFIVQTIPSPQRSQPALRLSNSVEY